MIAIVGGGPGGLALALMLGRRGLPVRVFEKRRWPVDKTCGEGIMPTGAAILRSLAIDLPGYAFTGVCYRLVDRPGCAAADFREGPGLAVRRTDLSLALSEACRAEPNVELFGDCPARLLERRGDAIKLEAGGRVHLARLVIGADGLHSQVRRWAGLQGPTARGGRWGMRQHFRLEPWNCRVEVHVGEGFEAYVTPVGDSEVGISILCRRPLNGNFADYARRIPELRRRLEGARASSEVRALGPLSQSVKGPVAPGVALLGDASGYVDACTGEGISLALAQAAILADAILPDLTLAPRVESSYRRLLWPYKMTTYANLYINQHPWLRSRVFALLSRRPDIFQGLLSLNMGTLSMTRFLLQCFSLRGDA